MAKIKFRPHPGALSKILHGKGMTQLDTASNTGIDRKTLAKINRGEEVKLETIQNLAKRLHVTVAHFDEPSPSAESAAAYVDETISLRLGMESLLLRKLNVERLVEMLKDADRVQWRLNVQVLDKNARTFLGEFEEAVIELHRSLRIQPHELNDEEADSLRLQLRRLEKTEHVANFLKGLPDHRLAVLGADYLLWESSDPEQRSYEHVHWEYIEYVSRQICLLTVEPQGVQMRRTQVSPGSEPPQFAPDNADILVNGRKLPVRDLDDEIPF